MYCKICQFGLDTPQTEALNHLKSSISAEQCLRVQSGKSPQHLPLILDLSLIQTLDYYTGIVFEVVVTSKPKRILGRMVVMTN